MTTNRSERSKPNTNWSWDRQVVYEDVILAYEDVLGEYIGYDSTDGNDILVMKANNTDFTARTVPTTNRTARTPI